MVGPVSGASIGVYTATEVRRHNLTAAAPAGVKQIRAADAPAGLIASEALRAALTAIEAEQRTVSRAGMAANVADGTLSEVSGLVRDARAADVALANSAGFGAAERAAMEMQRRDAVQAADRLVRNAEFAGNRLFDGTASLRAGDATLDLPEIDTSTATVGTIATTRGEIGAFQQSVAARGRVLETAAINTVAAEASVRDRVGVVPGLYPDPSAGPVDKALAARTALAQRAQLLDLMA
ncbi:MAG: hypothetical protein AAGA57_02295 [Planctomycetota bacterium]